MKRIQLFAVSSIIAFLAGCSATATKPTSEATTAADVSPAIEAEQQAASSEPAESQKTELGGTEPANIEATPTESSASATSPIGDDSYVCAHGSQKRVIRVSYNTEAGLACEVNYEKSSGIQTLWTARSESGYCAERAAEFATKQAGWGWQCTDENGIGVPAPTFTAEASSSENTESVVESSDVADESESVAESSEVADETESLAENSEVAEDTESSSSVTTPAEDPSSMTVGL